MKKIKNLWLLLTAMMVILFSIFSFTGCTSLYKEFSSDYAWRVNYIEEQIDSANRYISNFDKKSKGGYKDVWSFDFKDMEQRVNSTKERYANDKLYSEYIPRLEKIIEELKKREVIQANLEKEYIKEKSKPKSIVTQYSDIGMPKEMAESFLFIRHGVDDFSGQTVSDFFLTKEFIPVKQLDGTYASIRFKKSFVVGNTYNLIVESIYGKDLEKSHVVETTIKYTLIYEDGITFYDRVRVNNHKTGESLDSYNFEEKASFLMMVFSNN